MEFTFKKNTYRTGRMNARTQFHVSRRLSPLLAKLGGLAGGELKLKYAEDGTVEDFEGDLEDVLSTLAEALTVLKDEEADYVLDACLDVTERKQAGGGWAPLRQNGVTMFDGLSLPELMQIAYYVVRENLEDFFGELPSLSGLQGFLKAKGLLGPVSPAAKTGS